MKWRNLFRRTQKRRVFTRADCSESDLIHYGVDHLKSAKRLYDISDRWTWEYLHSAAVLSHLSIELVLKACILHVEKEFPAEHDLRRLFRRLRKTGIKLSAQNEKWLNQVSRFNTLRYPDRGTGPDVDVSNWTKTKALFEELRSHVPEEIQKHIVLHERYPSNVKSGKTIWPE